MKKPSIEILLLLCNVYGKRQIADFRKDIQSLSGEQWELLLSRLEEQRTRTFSLVGEEIGAELEKRKEASGTADEITYLLLSRYKLKVGDAAQKLSEQLESLGYQVALSGPQNKANFLKWMRGVCSQVPREKMMSLALTLRP